jgi:peptide/nickel transport system permease protein
MRLQPPGTEGYLLGTDQLGRDVLSRLIFGARISLSIGFIVMLLTAVVGVAIGLISGYVGGKVDTLIMRIVDVWLAFPFLLLAIALVAVLGRGLDKLVFALVLSGWPGFARPVRGEVLQLREREYVLSARVLGVSSFGVMFKHLLPNVMPTILVLAALDLGSNILALAALSFLGLGMGAEVATWGGMLAQGRNYVATSWWLAALPGIAIFLVVMSSNLIGDWIRDRYDPRSPFRLAKNQAAAEARARLAQDAVGPTT